MGIIAIITDFGTRGHHYVAEMKGVALQMNPRVQFVDITHEIRPYSVIEAAYVLQTVIFTFAPDTIFVCVVDPGVGSARDILAVQLTTGHTIIGPDNGIFTYFISHDLIKYSITITAREYFFNAVEKLPFLHQSVENLDSTPKPSQKSETKQSPSSVELALEKEMIDQLHLDQDEISSFSKEIASQPPSHLIDSLDPFQSIDEDEFSKRQNAFLANKIPNSSHGLQSISSTFHGRDVMMPVAVHLSQGLDLFALGEIKSDLTVIPNYDAEVSEDHRKITGMILYIDAFSNIITNIPTHEFDTLIRGIPSKLDVKIAGKSHFAIRVPFFAGQSPDQLLLVDGSSGLLELCYNQDRAGEKLKVAVGQLFEITILTGGFDD